MFYGLKIQKSVSNDYLLCSSHLRLKSKKSKLRKFWQDYNTKLLNNISRAKSQIFNITAFNKFSYFFTLTCSSVYNRQDLKGLLNRFRKHNYYLQRRYKDLTFQYVLIPEYHLDGKSWHFHGFLSNDYNIELQKNKNGYYEIAEFNNIGWNSISKIKNYKACCKYITKYITKEHFLLANKGDRLYYCSKGLVRSNVIEMGVTTSIPPVHFDFKSDYCFKSTLNKKQYKRLENDLENTERFQYYRIS